MQVLGLDGGANTPVSSSFPGRMDWETNKPKADRLDGWIVQFGGNAGAVSDEAPEKVKVWALCVPGTDIDESRPSARSADPPKTRPPASCAGGAGLFGTPRPPHQRHRPRVPPDRGGPLRPVLALPTLLPAAVEPSPERQPGKPPASSTREQTHERQPAFTADGLDESSLAPAPTAPITRTA